MSVRVAVIPPRRADGLVADVYSEIRRDFGAVVEPFTLHSPAPELLAGVWHLFRESLLVGAVDRHLKEAVATAVSETNRCPWCVDAHMVMLHATDRHDVVGAMRGGREPRDREAAAAIAWAMASRSPGSEALAAPPFDAGAAPEFIGTAVGFHYINRTVSALLGPTPLPFGGRWGRATSRLAGRWYARAVKRPKQPALSAPRAPETLPRNLAWAAATPSIAAAFGQFASAVDEAGAQALDASTRSLVEQRVLAWEGEFPPPSQSWVDEALGGVDRGTRPGARLALLAALAPHQIDASVIEDFRDQGADDGRIVGAIAWSSFVAADRVAEWIAAPLDQTGGSRRLNPP